MGLFHNDPSKSTADHVAYIQNTADTAKGHISSV